MDNRKLITLAAAALLCCASAAQTVVTAPEAPFEFEALVMYDFPDREFPITRYGARRDDPEATTEAFAKAMKACSKAGGGKVVVPEGEWLSGPVHFSSNCLLWLDEGSKLVFEDDPELYLPAVRTSWEGTECMNYSPLIYAYECENVGIAGPGTIAPKMDFWRTWFDRPDAHIQATRQLYAMCSTGVPVEHRRMEEGEANMRPHLIQFNRCTNVRLNDFKIRESPFWTIHLYMCSDVWANGLDVYAHGHNNDGIDIEMTRHAVIENCRFDQGDDAVVLKAGRNQDAWRLAQPTEDIVVRDCEVVKGHCLLGIGSEMSAGVRRVYMHDCHTTDSVFRLFYIKTNHRRGGFIEDIFVITIRRNVNITVDIRFAVGIITKFNPTPNLGDGSVYRSHIWTYQHFSKFVHLHSGHRNICNRVCRFFYHSFRPIQANRKAFASPLTTLERSLPRRALLTSVFQTLQEPVSNLPTS